MDSVRNWSITLKCTGTMVEITIGLGIVLSLVLSETLGVTAGGIIVPGYIAMNLNQPVQVVVTLVAAMLVLAIIRMLGRFMFGVTILRLPVFLILFFWCFYFYFSVNLVSIYDDWISCILDNLFFIDYNSFD